MTRFNAVNGRFRRGMGRVAILAGVIGLVVAGWIAYIQVQELAKIRAQHDRFLALMTAPETIPIRKAAEAIQDELHSSSRKDQLDQIIAADKEAKQYY
jgi:hypothetical protein